MSKLDGESARKILEALDIRASKIAKEETRTSSYNKTKFGIITAKNVFRYTVKIDKIEYKNIKAVKNIGILNIGDVVTCLVPNNNMSNMFILGVVDGSSLEYVYTSTNQTISGDKRFLDTIECENIRGRNLFDKTKIAVTNTTNWTLEQTNVGIKVIHNTAFTSGGPRLVLELTENTVCTVKTVENTSSTVVGVIDIYIEGAYFASILAGQSYTFNSGTGNVAFHFITQSYTTGTTYFDYPQFELGTTVSDYTQYIGNYITDGQETQAVSLSSVINTSAGFSSAGQGCYYVKYGKIVQIVLNVLSSNALSANTEYLIVNGTLPSGIKPLINAYNVNAYISSSSASALNDYSNQLQISASPSNNIFMRTANAIPAGRYIHAIIMYII